MGDVDFWICELAWRDEHQERALGNSQHDENTAAKSKSLFDMLHMSTRLLSQSQNITYSKVVDKSYPTGILLIKDAKAFKNQTASILHKIKGKLIHRIRERFFRP